MLPDFNRENKLYEGGVYKFIAGSDEVGRGSIAGPIVVATVILNRNYNIPGLNESKSLTRLQREKIYQVIIQNVQAFGVGTIDNTIIDHLGIIHAQHQALLQSIQTLKIKSDFLLMDYVSFAPQINFPYLAIVKGDTQVASIAAASVIAKVTRDRWMNKMHLIYPNYGFNTNSGYGTMKHFQAIKKYGLCKIHRKTFINGLGVRG